MEIKQITAFTVLFVIWVSTACISSPESYLPAQLVPVPENNYGSVLRFGDGRILLQTGRLSPQQPDYLHYYWLIEKQFVNIPTEDDSRCSLTEYSFPYALPDGRLGLSKICRDYWRDRPFGQNDARFIIAYDWKTGDIEQIVEAPLPFEASNFSWNPEMTRGVQGIGSLLGTIYWLTPRDMEPMTLTIGNGDKSWRLDENLLAMYENQLNSRDIGIARNPAWSPDGKWIAFWASTNVIGHSGQSRARGAYTLYLLEPNSLKLTQILENVENPWYIVWSPDSRWLAFTGTIGLFKDGLWLISSDGGVLDPNFVQK